MIRALDILSKFQKYFLGLAIFLSLSAVSVTVSNGQIDLNFHNYPLIMILLVAVSIFLALVYVAIDKHEIRSLSNEIKARSSEGNENFSSLLLILTSRQKEVYELIANGKSNKEIMSILFIEQSTLKSHINQIYKKLHVKDRKELKSKATQQ